MPTEPRPVRLKSACDSCNQAKTKCSGQLTGCNRCVSLNVMCHYSESRVGRVPGVRGRNRRREEQQQRRQSLMGSPASLSSTFHDSPEADIIVAAGASSLSSPTEEGIIRHRRSCTADRSCPTPTPASKDGTQLSLDQHQQPQPSPFAAFDLSVDDNDYDMSLYDIPEILRIFPGPEDAIPAEQHPQPHTPRIMGGPYDIQGIPLPTPISINHNPTLPDETAVEKLPSNNKRNAASLSVLSLLGVAHQVELHIARPPHDLYMTVGIVRSALQRLDSITECQSTDQEHQHQQHKAGLMESVVVQQVTDLLFEAFNIAFCSETNSQHNDRMYTATGGQEFPGASALDLGTSTALHHVDEDDRRAIQAVVVQRQVKRALSVLQRLRRRNKAISRKRGGIGGASSGTISNEETMTGVTAASELSLDNAECRLTDLSEMLQKYADLNL